MGKARGQQPPKVALKPAAVKASKPAAVKASKSAAVTASKLSVGDAPSIQPEATDVSATGQTVIPVVAEFLEIGKRVIDTGRGVRVSKTVRELEHVVDEPLNQDELQVERVAINRYLDPSESPSIRQEDDVTVVPILEEVLVTEKRLLLKEEVRITRVRRQTSQPQRVLLRAEEVLVERFDETDPSTQASASASTK